MQTHRKDKVEEAYRRNMSELLLMGTKNPLFQTVTVTRVLFTDDLKLAKVYYHCTGGRSQEKILQKAFSVSRRFLRNEMADRLNLRYMPDIKFFYDDSVDEQERVNRLFEKIESVSHETGEED